MVIVTVLCSSTCFTYVCWLLWSLWFLEGLCCYFFLGHTIPLHLKCFTRCFFMYCLLSLNVCCMYNVSHDKKFPDLTEEAVRKPYMWIFFRRLSLDVCLSNHRLQEAITLYSSLLWACGYGRPFLPHKKKTKCFGK